MSLAAVLALLPPIPEGFTPFIISLLVMGGIFLVEALTVMMGVGIFGLLDALVPDVDVPSNGWGSLLNWFRAGKVPIGMVLIIFLTAFGLIGLGIQYTIYSMVGITFPTAMACGVAFFLSIYPVRWGSRGIAYIMPETETDALGQDAFVGHEAEIVIGTAIKGKPAPAKFYDAAGTRHDLMVEPSVEGLSFNQGDKVLLISKEGNVFLADPN